MSEPAAAALRIGAEMPDLETPAYVYDLDEVAANHTRLRSALPRPSRLYYSLKANPHPAVLRTLCEAGCQAEVCSLGELAAALAAGFPAAEMLYTGPGKRDGDLDMALDTGVRHFSVDSAHALSQLDAAAGRHGTVVRAVLRVNDALPTAGQGLTMTGVASQFGADVEWIEAEPHLFRERDRVEVVGLHFYTGSNLAGPDAVVAQFEQAIGTAARLSAALRVPMRLLDLGGGFPAPFARAGAAHNLAGLAERVEKALDTGVPGWRDGAPEVAFESGRYLVGTCGTLLVRVLDAKHSHGRSVVVFDAGINVLGGMSGLRRLPQIVPNLLWPPESASDETAGASSTLLAGPLCTPLDSWARDVALPDVRPGDLLAVPNVGAYGLYASLVAFLGHPAPVEIVFRDGQIVEMSRLSLTRDRVRHPATEPVSLRSDAHGRPIR